MKTVLLIVKWFESSVSPHGNETVQLCMFGHMECRLFKQITEGMYF